MNLYELLDQVYDNGLLALSIALLAIAIIIYPTLKKHSGLKKQNLKQKRK